MIRAGSIILSLWCVLNIIPALFIIVTTTFLDKNHPLLAIKLDQNEISSLSSEALTLINSMAVFANGGVVALSLLALMAIWAGLYRRVKWVFWALLISMSFYILAGFASDIVSKSNYYTASFISALILAAGFALVAIGLFKSNSKHSA